MKTLARSEVSVDALRQEATLAVGHCLPKEMWDQFHHLNDRLLIGITCLRKGFTDLAYRLFSGIAEAGPQENANQHFAYIRSLIELAELDAGEKRFHDAAVKMRTALLGYPDSMGYLMSKVHLEVYLTYYLFESGETAEAFSQIAELCLREKLKFGQYPREDALGLVSPGLCYAIHQWALFFAQQLDWQQAVGKFKEMEPYVATIDPAKANQAQGYEQQQLYEEAFAMYEQAYSYREE